MQYVCPALTGTMGLNPNHENLQTIIHPPPNFTVGATHLGRKRLPGIHCTLNQYEMLLLSTCAAHHLGPLYMCQI